MANDQNVAAWRWYERADEFNGYQGRWRFTEDCPSNGVASKGMQPLFTKDAQRYEILKEAGDNLIEAGEGEAYETIYKMMEEAKKGQEQKSVAKYCKGQTVFCRSIGRGQEPLLVTRIDDVQDTFVYRVQGGKGWYSAFERELSEGIPEAAENKEWIAKLRKELLVSKMTHNFTFTRDEVIELLGGKFALLGGLKV